MGVVFLAEDESLGREIALKILDRDLVTASDFERRFRQEAKTVAKLQHPNIVQIHALESLGGILAIDMAYIERGPLSHANASPEQTVLWSADILSALQCCHDSEIVHRDVKPSNILLATDGRAMLSDFGLAKLLAIQHSLYMQSTASSCMFVGTPRYAPPEAWDGREPSPTWDVYSLGMVLYEKLSPTFPYDAITPLAFLKQMMRGPIPSLREVDANVSPELSETVAAMLARDPEDRPPDGSAALERLRATPEFERTSGLYGSTIVQRQHRLKALVRRVGTRRRLRAVNLRPWWIGVILVFLSGAVLWQVASHVNRLEDGGSVSVPIDLLSPQVFDTVDPSGPSVWSAHWLMEPEDEPDKWRILASADSHVWDLRAQRLARDQFTFTGNWAEYTDPTARMFRYGECQGTGRMVPDRNEIAVNLEFRNQLDADEWMKSFIVRPAVTAVSAESFLARLEVGDYIPALLYNELQPRDLTWLNALELTWLSRVSQIVTVPFTDSSGNDFVVDGQLNEPAWQSALSKNAQRMGQVSAREPGNAPLKIRYSNEALFLGIRAEGLEDDCFLELGILKSFDIHTADSPRWMARAHGSTIVSAMCTINQNQVPWTCDWQSATIFQDGVWQAEVRIPFRGLLPGTTPHVEQRWRISCDLHTNDSEDASKPVVRWGYSDHADIERGILVVFGSRELSQ